MDLIKLAWEARKNAHPHKSGTKVGCVIQTDSRNIYPGWNIEGLWMTSLHAVEGGEMMKRITLFIGGSIMIIIGLVFNYPSDVSVAVGLIIIGISVKKE